MSEKNPGGRGYVPDGEQVQCLVCGAQVTLSVPTMLLRRHLDPSKPKDLERRERLCPGSRTASWRSLDADLKERP